VLSPESQSVQLSKIKNGGLDQYGAEPFEQQQFGPVDVEGSIWRICQRYHCQWLPKNTIVSA